MKTSLNLTLLVLLSFQSIASAVKARCSRDSSVIFYYNDLNAQRHLMRELDWHYQLPYRVYYDSNQEWVTAQRINDSWGEHDMNFETPDVFLVRVTNDTLILERTSQKSFNDFLTLYTITKVPSKNGIELRIVLSMSSPLESVKKTAHYQYKQKAWKRSEKFKADGQ